MIHNALNKSKKHLLLKSLKYLVFALGLIGFGVIFYIFVVLQPNNKRNWEFGFEVLPKITINNEEITIKDLRDFSFNSNNIIPNYKNQTVNLNKLQRVWFVFEPFKVKPFTNFNGVAHTYFVFDFENSDPIVVSVEARREKNEKYDAWVGAFNQFELIYLWSTEKDQTIRRVTVEHNSLYMYPLTISQENSKKLFLELAKITHELETKPRFYNTFSSNCTNELAKVANKVKPGSIPLNKALFFPGYSVEELYKLGFIPNNSSISQIKKKYYVSDFIQNHYQETSFSNLIREKLLQN